MIEIDTTININPTIQRKILEAGCYTRKERSILIIRLMKRLMQNSHLLFRYSRSVEYQEPNKKHKYRRVHIKLPQRDYEYFLDMRKLSKRSVSFLITIAVDQFLDKIISENNCDDDLRFKSYILIYEYINEAFCFRTYWDIPSMSNEYNELIL